MPHRRRKRSGDRLAPAFFGIVDVPLQSEGDLQDNHSAYTKNEMTTYAVNSKSRAAAEQGAEQVAKPSRLQEADRRLGSPRTRSVERAGAVASRPRPSFFPTERQAPAPAYVAPECSSQL